MGGRVTGELRCAAGSMRDKAVTVDIEMYYGTVRTRC